MKNIINRIADVAKTGICRLAVALTILLGLASTAWAANGNGTLNYELTASGDSGLYAAVVDNRIDKRIASSASFGTKVFTLASPTLEIPASDTLPAGTKIKVTQIEFCRNSQNDANSEAIYVKINDVTSGARAVGGGYSSTIGIGVNGAASGTGVKITYNFSPALEVVVGTSYDVEFLNASSEALSSVKYCYVSSTGNGSVAAQSLLNLDGSDKVLFKVTGTVEYTFNAAGGTLSLNDGANWTSGAAPAIGSPNVSFNVTADTTVNVAANTSCAKVSITGDHQLTLSGSQVTASDGFFVKDNATFAPGFTIASIVDISATAKVVANSGETIYVSNFKGAGTIVFDGVLPSNAAADSSTVTASATNRSDWTGTLWLKNYNTAQESKGLYMPYWGNVNSKVKFTNVAGYLPCKQGNTQYLGYDDTELGEWVLEDEVVNGATKYAFTKTDGFSGYWVRFKKLSGSGTMAEKSGKTQTPQVRIADGSAFTGTLKLDQGMRVAFSDSDVSINAKQIVIASGEEVTASTAWTTDGFVVNGTLNLNATPNGNVVSGSGTVNLGSLSVANGISGFASAAAWTGKVVVPSVSTGSNLSIGFNSLGNSGSTVILKGLAFSGDYPAVYPVEAGTGSTVNPTLQIDGDVTFTWGHSSEYVTSFSRITGTGNLNFDPSNGNYTHKYKINTLEGYTGLLGVYNDGTYKMQLEIGTLALDSMPTTSDRIVKIKTASNWGNIVNVADIAVTIGGEATEYKLVKKNVGTSTAGLYLAPAAIKASDGTFTTYESVDAAFTALSSLANDAYDYMAVYESATVTFTGFYKTPKIKTVGEGVVLTINSGYGDYGWIAGSPSDGVVTYSVGPISADYTWVGAENAYWSLPASWSCGGVAANRAVDAIDNVIFSSDASVTIQADVSVASIRNSAAVTFAAASAKTITVGDGGVVMTALGNSITLSNVTLSKTPTTTAATLAVQTTGGGEDPTVYTVVNSVASVDGVGYATMAEASEALKIGSIMTLQQDYDGTVTIYPGTYLVKNGHTATSVVGATVDGDSDPGIIVTENTQGGFWQCVDQRTATWSGTGAAWSSPSCWAENFAPTAYTAVTIPATEGHATAITLSGDVTIKSLALGAGETLTLSRSGETARTFTTSEAIVLTSGQSIVTGVGVSISPAITTEDANSYVKSVISDGVTTYTVADHKATVYDSGDAEVKEYDTVADAVSAATEGQKVALFADSNEALTLNGKSITFNEGSYTFTGTFTGNGTVVLTSTLKSAATARWAEGWTGTVVLPANQTFGGFNFDNYGRVGSIVQLQGANSGWLQYRSNNDPIATTVEIPAGASLTITGWSPTFANGFNVIRGAGTFATSTTAPDTSGGSSYTAYFLLKDVSNFTGSLSASGAGIAIGDTRIANSVAGGKIIVSSGKTATVGASATWTAGTIEVNGNVSVASGGALSGTIAGSGEISLAALVNSAMSLGDWTGTVELPAISETVGGFRFDYYGKAGSTVKISKGFTGWLNASTGDAYQVKTRILVTGCTFTISGSNSGTWYQIAKLSGDGNFSFVQTYAPSGFHILEMEDYSGTLSNTIGSGTPTALTVSRLNLASAPVAEQKLINTITPDTVNLEAVYVDGTRQSVKLVKQSDGIYVASAVTVTIPTVPNTTVSVAYTSGGASQTATAAGNITVDAGTDVTVTWTAASGHKITAGAIETISSVMVDTAAAAPTVAPIKGWLMIAR